VISIEVNERKGEMLSIEDIPFVWTQSNPHDINLGIKMLIIEKHYGQRKNAKYDR